MSKAHSASVKTNLNTLRILAVSLLVVGCQRQASPVPVVPVVTAVKQQTSARSTLTEVRRVSAEVDRRNDAVRTQIDTSVANAQQYRDYEYTALKNLILKAQKKGSVTSEELEEIIDRVIAQQGQLDNFLARLKQVQAELRISRQLRQQIDEQLTEALARVAVKDAEADNLRQQLADQQLATKAVEKSANEHAEAAAKHKADAARILGRLDVFFRLFIVTLIVAVLSLGCNYLQLKRGGILPI